MSKKELDVLILSGLTPYQEAWDMQKELVKEVDKGRRSHTLLLLEHPHIYTLGRAGHEENLLITHQERERKGIDFQRIDRGGDITYHGPGQLVGYLIFHLADWGNDPHRFLRLIEEGLIQTLKFWNIEGERKETYTGVWVGDEKIAAIGVKLNRAKERVGYISSHGFALNISPDLQMFQYIRPCGIVHLGVTSMEKVLGKSPAISSLYSPIMDAFSSVFHFEKRNETYTHWKREVEPPASDKSSKDE
ncbi:lipoyl(octanoyl) transferase LipB [Thermicanus aegyptius]|uniref:lipoyl(octanoyl) transferase LipB n=1 Tax=Thermicanus aegyptius TaxID=94009 RepID=UPI000403F172|nr:lipoyl(octanoyl) transferase LipB [Thermicanus aegyptius]